MLSRAADSLYWMARYMERADFLARILDAAGRLTALPTPEGAPGSSEWDSVIAISDVAEGFRAAYGAATDENVRAYLAFDAANPSSIRSCLGAARENARAVRTALTGEVWEAVNDAWNALSRFDGAACDMQAFGRLLDWVKGVTLGFDGACHRTMLRNDAYWFVRLGTGVERADNTARILDVKYHLLLPEGEEVGGGLDYFQWSTILREVSALTAYRWVYRESIKPWLVADLLILNRQAPRSLAACAELISKNLDFLSGHYGRRGAAQRLAAASHGRLAGLTIEQVFQAGLHEFIEAFLVDNAKLSDAITEQYLH